MHSLNIQQRKTKKTDRENKMSEQKVDMDYIFLHGYIRNIFSDTQVCAHQLRVDRSIRPTEKNIQNHAKLGRMKEMEGGNRSGTRTGPALGGWGN